MNYIVMDFEYNQPFAFKDSPDAKPVEGCPNEIIQIGAVKLNSKLDIVSYKDYLIKPTLYHRVHPYVKKITGISTSMLQQQRTFVEIYGELVEFMESSRNILCVWGGNDIKEFCRNILFYNLSGNGVPKRFVNVQTLAGKHLNQPSGKDIGLKNAVTELGLQMELEFHSALNDALYTAEVFKVVNRENMQINSFKLSQFKGNKKVIEKPLNTGLLFEAVEKEVGRKLTKRERTLFKKVYNMGKAQIFNN